MSAMRLQRVYVFGLEYPSSKGKFVRFTFSRGWAHLALFVKNFHFTPDLNQQRLALAVYRFACGHLHPAFADAIFLHIHALLVIEPDANIVLKHGRHMVGATGVQGQMVWQWGALWGSGVVHKIFVCGYFSFRRAALIAGFAIDGSTPAQYGRY
jgi:hypothetical protein